MNVVKKSGKKQKFSKAKLMKSIQDAAKEAGLSPAKRKVLAKEVVDSFVEAAKKKKVMKAVEIRRSVLGRLDRRAKSVSKAWRRYDKKKKAKK